MASITASCAHGSVRSTFGAQAPLGKRPTGFRPASGQLRAGVPCFVEHYKCAAERKSLGLRSAAYRGQRLASIFVSQNSSSRPRVQNRPFRVYSDTPEKLILGAADKNGIQFIENSAENKVSRLTRSFFQFSETVAAVVVQMGDAVRDVFQKPNTQEEVQLLRALQGRMACAAAPLLFAAISQSVNTPLTVVASGMAKWLELYSGVLMVRVLLSWFPNIPWERQPLQAMRDMCDPYLNLFRNIIPPLFNALDLSPMLAFLVLGVLTSILNTTVQAS